MRAEAVAALGVWAEPSTLDRVDGAYLGPVRRSARRCAGSHCALTETLLADASAEVREAAVVAAARLDVDGMDALLADRLNMDAAEEVRAAALKALFALPDADRVAALRRALADSSAEVRMLALELTPEADLSNDEAASVLSDALRQGGAPEQQSALATLSELPSAQTDAVLGELLERLESGDAALEIRLDILEAAEGAGSDALKARAQAWRDANPPFAAALYGETGGEAVRFSWGTPPGSAPAVMRQAGEMAWGRLCSGSDRS